MHDKQNYSQIRQYYRIRYPLSYRPKIRIQGEDCEGDVAELSERGVRFFYQGKIILKNGLNLKVNIIFHDGESFELEGEVLAVVNEDIHEGLDMKVNITFHDSKPFELKGKIVRIAKEDVIVRFSDWLPLDRIMKEQIYLRTHFVGYM
jgi:hypothetical protein